MIVVSNSSPIIILASVRKLDILKSLFQEILIPETVFEEVVLQNRSEEIRDYIAGAIGDYIKVQGPNVSLEFERKIGSGERGVLNLAVEKNADVVLVDDRKARKEANRLGLEIMSTTMVLELAEEKGLISSLAEVRLELEQKEIFIPGY